MTDEGLAETGESGLPLRRQRFTTMADQSARTEQVIEAWHVHGRLSRHDGPAQVFADGVRAYWVEGELHRAGGKPAIEYPAGYSGYGSGPDEYLVHGRHHRLSGPARAPFRSSTDSALGFGAYFIDGKHEPDVRTRWAVLRHYTGEGELPRLAIDNVNAWRYLEEAGAISRNTERIEPTALALALRLHPN